MLESEAVSLPSTAAESLCFRSEHDMDLLKGHFAFNLPWESLISTSRKSSEHFPYTNTVLGAHLILATTRQGVFMSPVYRRGNRGLEGLRHGSAACQGEVKFECESPVPKSKLGFG